MGATVSLPIKSVFVAVAATAGLVLAGWATSLPVLQGFGGSIDMNPSTAACFLACSAALVLSATGSRRQRQVALALAGAVAALGTVRVLGYLFGVEIGIDRLLVGGTANRMALNTALAFVFVALALLLLKVETRGGHRLAEPAAAAGSVVALLALTGHAYQVPLLSQVAPHVIPMAEVTALAFLALTFGLLAYRPERGWVAVVTGQHAGGAMARRLLPLAIGAPLLLGFFALQGRQTHVYGSAAGFATFAVACVVVLTVVVLATARSLGRADQALRAAHAAEQRLRSQLEEVGAASLAISDIREIEDVLQKIVDEARSVADARFAVIAIGDDPEQPLSRFAQSGMTPAELDAIGRAPHHPADHPGIGSFLAVPVRYRGSSVGTIYLGDKLGGHEFTAEDEHAIQLLSSHVGVALENARLYRDAVLDRVRLATVLEQLPEGVVVRDEAGQVVVFNETARSLAQRPDGWLEMYQANAGAVPLAEHPLRRALRNGETVIGVEAELRNQGRAIPVLVNAAPIRRPDGASAGAVAVFQDITPLKEAERLREEWNAVIAHDLRQPVNVIQLGATLLEQRLEQAKDRQTAARIADAARKLAVMIADLLELSRLEANRLDLRREMADVAALSRELIERTVVLEPQHSIRLETDGPTELSVDPSRIEQVLGNLLSNAIKYGQPDSEIVVAVQGRRSAVEVSVTNRGAGIPADELPRLFTRFHRAGAARQSGVRGIGLGLYLCKGLVEAHGGTIGADSVPGETTTFRFTLPRVERAVASAAQA